ncbi:hypothetical protein [Ralstonia syzygii]|uniref:Uncharacterized protein n=1 Tax=Ralstonia syzygii R24 TaxID=907261 RepID=G3ABK7_9RALS|nr:hypothetical protein [Ralstonia syzygii]CCA86912.1 conserved hypothetical protein [Ralstonia syzygii R24]
MDPSKVNSQVIDVINQTQLATMSPQVVLTSGAGKAYQSVAQSTALAVQDATDALRNLSTIATTAAGVAMAQFLATGDPKYATALSQAQDLMTNATDDYAKIGSVAAAVLKGFPAG